MEAIAGLVKKHNPDVIFFQLSKPSLENIAHRKFPDSPTGRGYLEADINPDPATAMMKPIRLATTQLERPIPPAPMNCLERQAQAMHAIVSLSRSANVVFGGDMSWDDATDGPFPRSAGWLDAWTQLKNGSGDWTYDAIWNEEAAAFNGHVADQDNMRKRSDRFLCKLKDYKLRNIELIGDKREIKFMTYNVWSREDVVVYDRMQAIGGLVEKHDPDVIFFQEVTPFIRSIFQSSAWWKRYHSCPVYPEDQATGKQQQSFCLLLSKSPLENFACRKFHTSPTGRAYLEADINPDPAATTRMKPIHVATTQLEPPVPPASMHFMERQAQAKHAIKALSSAANVVFGGDMSWGYNADGPFPLAPGWLDAWPCLKGGLSDKDWTYDGLWNEEAAAFNGYITPHSSLRKRSDRFLCNLRDYRVSRIELIGDSSLGLRYYKTSYWKDDVYNYNVLKPSCHRGLVMTIVPVDD
ncbi:hypothetical protein PR202_gb20929 [Eleusine coracana subsp. coracana]|uniref:Endonuclease/exonuclease/phosphatase domain-containing protein n=1 Tax=Eleusine coracana subsp. coracana TaxID=191504 RepID=A0AAV5FBX8_ELECO|nr:hypothetical protein PR202_gb20929 [Eleusine coracana subsp. coracana]